MFKKLKRKYRLSNIQIIILGFLSLILLGGLLLCLPFSSSDGTWTPFLDSLFTSTSATCVTGLVVFDTFTHWSLFGQLIILTLIQIGGIGFMTIIALFAFFAKRKIGLRERTLLVQSAGSLSVGGVVALVRKIIKGTLFFELLGAALLCISFVPKMGGVGVYFAIFHAVSAFCNAGFDLMGRSAPFSSLTDFVSDPVVNITIMLLIIIGGLGFLVWNDILNHGRRFSAYKLHSKIVLVTSAVLVFGGAVLFFIFERNNAFSEMSTGQSIMASFFSAITPRTAGMNTYDLTTMSDSSNILTCIFMLIGGSPGSTAGGIKTTTVMVLFAETIAAAKSSKDVTIFKRRLDENAVRQASAILMLYVSAIIVSCLIICAVEPFTAKQIFFEVCSAAGTVGLTLGITPQLGLLSKIIIMVLMFAGRIGGFTLALAFSNRRIYVPTQRPTEKILIG